MSWLTDLLSGAVKSISDNAKNLGAGEYTRSFSVNGVTRSYEVHVPWSYRVAQNFPPRPVVLVLHGAGGTAGHAKWQSQMNEVSDDEGFIAVYPQALPPSHTPKPGTVPSRGPRPSYDPQPIPMDGGIWNAGVGLYKGTLIGADDVEFIRWLIPDLAFYFKVDRTRVYACGISNGAHMVYRLASELPQFFAGFGAVGAQRMPAPGQVAVPLHMIHGLQDQWQPYYGGVSPNDSYFQPYQIDPAPMCLEAWQRVSGNVRLDTVSDGGHCWPGGRVSDYELRRDCGPLSNTFDASVELWRFFREFRSKA